MYNDCKLRSIATSWIPKAGNEAMIIWALRWPRCLGTLASNRYARTQWSLLESLILPGWTRHKRLQLDVQVESTKTCFGNRGLAVTSCSSQGIRSLPSEIRAGKKRLRRRWFAFVKGCKSEDARVNINDHNKEQISGVSIHIIKCRSKFVLVLSNFMALICTD